MRDLRVLATYPALQSEEPYVRAMAFLGDELAYGTYANCAFGKSSYQGWALLGSTDEGVLLGWRERENTLEIATLDTQRVGLSVPFGRRAMMSNDGGWVAVELLEGRERRGYQLIDLATTEVVARHEPIRLLNEHLMAISHDGMYIAVGDSMSEYNGIIILPMRVRARRRWIVQRTPSSLSHVAFSHDGLQFAYSSKSSVQISRAPYGTHESERLDCEEPRAIAFHPRRPVLAVYRNHLELWDLTTKTQIARAKTITSISDLEYSRDGTRVAAAHYDGTVDVVEGQP